MSKGMTAAAGGLSAADKALLIPTNIREGVTLFEGKPNQVVGAFAGNVKAQGFFSMTITGDPRYAKNLFGRVVCNDQSLISDVSHSYTQWASNAYTVTFKRAAKLMVIGAGPFALAVGGVTMNGALQEVTVQSGTAIGITNYTGGTQVPSTIAFVEL